VTPGAQATGLESAQLKPAEGQLEQKRRAREGTGRLKKKTPTKRRTVAKVPDTKGTGQGLSYSGNISGSGSSLNINK